MDAHDDLLDVNCGRCGKRLRIRFDELQDLRTIDCEDCNKLPPREPPTSDGCDGMARHVASVRPGLIMQLRVVGDEPVQILTYFVTPEGEPWQNNVQTVP